MVGVTEVSEDLAKLRRTDPLWGPFTGAAKKGSINSVCVLGLCYLLIYKIMKILKIIATYAKKNKKK